MVVQSEKRLLWHPRQENKFVVGGGTQITLYEWLSESHEIRQVTAQLDLNLMKCFAWSPDSQFDDLIAVGLSTGKVDLMRLEATKYSRHHILSSGPSVSLPLRNSRSCNALAFSSADPNYLAVGLDKVRSDPSLVIWDIHTAMPSLSLEPITASNAVNVISPPQSRSHIPRGEMPPRTDSRIVQQHAPADIVSSVAFLPSSSTLLLAGISHRWLRLFDLRAPLIPPLSVATKVHGVALDPFEPHRIGCFGEGIATVWDTRRLQSPLLTFTEKDASADGARVKTGAAYATMEFSSTRRGILATLEKDSNHVRFWDLQQADVTDIVSPERTRSRDSSQPGKVTRSWPSPSSVFLWSGSSTSSSHMQSSTSGRGPSYNLVLSDTRKTKNFTRPLASFALLPDDRRHPLTSNIMVVNKEGDLELYAVHDTPKATSWSSRGDLSVSLASSYRVFTGFYEAAPPPEPWDIPVLPSVSFTKPPSLERQTDAECSNSRGRSRHSPQSQALTGRDNGGEYPTTTSRAVTGLAATRPGRTRTYSPAALRKLHVDHTVTPSKEYNQVLITESSGHKSADGLSLNGGQTRMRHAHVQRSRDASSVWRFRSSRTFQHIVEEDVSMVMRRRVVQGYGLANPLHNAMVVRSTTPDEPLLADLWKWWHHANCLLCTPTPRVEGYNFTGQGLVGIWDGFHSSQPQASTSTHTTPRAIKQNIFPNTPVTALGSLPSDSYRVNGSRPNSRRRTHTPIVGVPEAFLAAVHAIMERNEINPDEWKPSASTSRLSQRQLALQLCGWSLVEDDLSRALKRWEKEGRHSQAACWLTFIDQPTRAIETLMHSEDESLHMMSGMLAALAPSGTSAISKNPVLLEHCERLVVRLQDPYLRALLTYLTLKDWSEVLQEDALPLRERLAIAFQFLDDRELSSYLRRVADRCCHDGDIEGLIVTGLNAQGMDILQAYVDTTGDVQTATILSSLFPSSARDTRVIHWLDAYRDLLDGWKLFHHRCQFDIERGKILQDAIKHTEIVPLEWAPPQMLLRCNYCNKTMDDAGTRISKPTVCPHCGRPLPRCCVCLMTLAIEHDSIRNGALARSNTKDTIDDALVFCQTCRHGGHASHILQWFYGEDNRRSHGTCPVAGCDCRCADGF